MTDLDKAELLVVTNRILGEASTIASLYNAKLDIYFAVQEMYDEVFKHKFKEEK